ncbi:MAG: 4Fe-4S ferredoxin, partial [Gemmatimonadales bacterium]|nr:4Fe-4S ferredoxin [Gemmatimonadales bacterium]
MVSKLKEAIICLRAGRVTLPYPFAPNPPAPGFRGTVSVDAEKCIGCGGCANVCTPRAIVVSDPSQET